MTIRRVFMGVASTCFAVTTTLANSSLQEEGKIILEGKKVRLFLEVRR